LNQHNSPQHQDEQVTDPEGYLEQPSTVGEAIQPSACDRGTGERKVFTIPGFTIQETKDRNILVDCVQVLQDAAMFR
jgi:hypothetical protein